VKAERAKQKRTNGKTKPKRIQNSGYANRMARRKKLEENARIGRTFIDMPHVQRLETVQDWHVQIARIYRRTLTGTIPEYLATKLTYICTAGANLARMLQEMRELETLRQQLEQLQQNGLITREAVEYLPANGD
jgi:hypothetical protein